MSQRYVQQVGLYSGHKLQKFYEYFTSTFRYGNDRLCLISSRASETIVVNVDANRFEPYQRFSIFTAETAQTVCARSGLCQRVVW